MGLTDNVLMFFRLLTLHWLTLPLAEVNGELPESLKECNVSEEMVSTAVARETLATHSLSKTQMMVSGTWLVTLHGDHQLAKPPNMVSGPTTWLSTIGFNLPSLAKSYL